jgi:hypothetical protein
MIESRSRGIARRLTWVAAGLAMAVCLLSAGCTAPQRTVNILAVAEEAVQANLHADEALAAALAKQSQDQQAALNQAFLADFRGLAAQGGGKIAIEDLEQGKTLYDQKLSAILASREAVGKLFLNKQRTQQAALDLIEKARQLSSSDVEVRNELEMIQQEVARLLQVTFPSLAPVAQPTGADGGGQP